MKVYAGERMKVKKAVIPAAGLGTRFLPATKAQPKEMLPIINIPVIQYVVQEAIDSGIDDILIITGKNKRAIEDHFDANHELERILKDRGKLSLLRDIKVIPEHVSIHYIRQREQNGLGDAVRYAKKFVGSEPFAVLLGDDIILSDTPCTKQLIDIYERYKSPVLGVERIPKEKIPTKGIIDPVKVDDRIYLVKDLVEKPSLEEAPSDLGIAGRYILTADIFECIEKTKPGSGGEIQLTDSLRILERDIYAYEFFGRRYDIGNQLDFIKTTIEFALERQDLKDELKKYLKSLKI